MGRLLRIALAALAAGALTACAAPPPTGPPDPLTAAQQAVGRLAPGVSMDRFADVIGRPPEITRAAGAYEEALWIDDVWAVQAIVGPYREVQGYSITTRSDRFHPSIRALSNAVLGAVPLDGMPSFDHPAELVGGAGVGVHGAWWYSEAIMPAGVTAYRTVVLTASDGSQAGVDGSVVNTVATLVNDLSGPTSGPLQATPPNLSATARHGIVPTTFTLLAPKLAVDRLPADFRFGPSAEDVLAVFPAV
jgi:hypothetical protein